MNIIKMPIKINKKKTYQRDKVWRKKIGESIKKAYKSGKKKPVRMFGKNNPQWKGNKVGYGALHDWIKSRKVKPKFCELCDTEPPQDLANISGKYKRDTNDFEWICRRCHMKKDGRFSHLKLILPKKPMLLICKWCKKEFRRGRGNMTQRCCSVSCGLKYSYYCKDKKRIR